MYDFSNNDLLTYIKWLNGKGNPDFALTEDLDHWAEYEVYTASDLGDYLDAEIEDERREDNIVEDEVVYYDAPEPTWDAVSRHDCNEGW